MWAFYSMVFPSGAALAFLHMSGPRKADSRATWVEDLLFHAVAKLASPKATLQRCVDFCLCIEGAFSLSALVAACGAARCWERGLAIWQGRVTALPTLPRCTHCRLLV